MDRGRKIGKKRTRFDKCRAYLTKADTDLLARGRNFQSAEIAVVGGTEVTDARQTINDVLMATRDMEPGV
jgi:hypothetical protein